MEVRGFELMLLHERFSQKEARVRCLEHIRVLSDEVAEGLTGFFPLPSFIKASG